MLERIKDCISHPRFIGRYNKDKIGKIILIIFMFFILYLTVFGIRTFTENPIGEHAESVVVSEVISKQEHSIAYDSKTHKLTGNHVSIEQESFGLYILPNENAKFSSLVINIILKEDIGYIYYGDVLISEIEYSNIQASDFTFDGISNNNTTDIYNFRYFISSVLESSFRFFRIYNFAEGAVMTIITFMSLFLVAFIFARMINPTIEGKVRAKLVLYDTIIFLVCAMFASLFNLGWIAYIGYALPMIYTSITFKHIIRVVVPKK